MKARGRRRGGGRGPGARAAAGGAAARRGRARGGLLGALLVGALVLGLGGAPAPAAAENISCPRGFHYVDGWCAPPPPLPPHTYTSPKFVAQCPTREAALLPRRFCLGVGVHAGARLAPSAHLPTLP